MAFCSLPAPLRHARDRAPRRLRLPPHPRRPAATLRLSGLAQSGTPPVRSNVRTPGFAVRNATMLRTVSEDICSTRFGPALTWQWTQLWLQRQPRLTWSVSTTWRRSAGKSVRTSKGSVACMGDSSKFLLVGRIGCGHPYSLGAPGVRNSLRCPSNLLDPGPPEMKLPLAGCLTGRSTARDDEMRAERE
jgi:hypothetical protein